MDRRAWSATVPWVAKSWARLNDYHIHSGFVVWLKPYIVVLMFISPTINDVWQFCMDVRVEW